MPRQIPLTQGYAAVVDDEDYGRVSAYKWCALVQPESNTVYAVRAYGRKPLRTIRMHRFILDAPEGVDVDHKDRNGLNNVRSNLRLAEGNANQANSGVAVNNTSGYKGVSWDAEREKWFAKITVNYRQIGLGRFATAKEAAEAYDKAAVHYFGEFALTNRELESRKSYA